MYVSTSVRNLNKQLTWGISINCSWYIVQTIHTFLIYLQWKDKRQELQATKWKIPFGHKEKNQLFSVVIQRLEQVV